MYPVSIQARATAVELTITDSGLAYTVVAEAGALAGAILIPAIALIILIIEIAIGVTCAGGGAIADKTGGIPLSLSRFDATG